MGRIQGWNDKKKKRKKNRGTRKANCGPGVQRGHLMDSHGLMSVKTFQSHPGLSCCCIIDISVHQWTPQSSKQAPRMQWSRGGASLATKSRAVTERFRLTVANCPTQGCTIRRFCWAWSEASSGQSYTFRRPNRHQAELAASNLPTFHIAHIFPCCLMQMFQPYMMSC